MSENRAPQVVARADEVLRRLDIGDNPYFRAVQDGTMSLEVFRRTQEQFYWAVTFFPRPMAALVGRLPTPRLRLDILHNLVEEHGDFHEELFHHSTFRRFLESIGSKIQEPEQVTIWPAVRAFNAALTCACALDEMEVGVGCMGIIEYAFADLAARIGAAVVRHGWVAAERLVHYKLHAEIDCRHAEEFFAVVEPRWSDPTRRYYILQGLELGGYIFDRLYRDLLRGATEGPGR
jgi:pyrroloquinoline-quinone synthase